MPTATVTLISFQNALAEAADFIDARDFPSARLRLAKAGVLLAGMPSEAADSAQRLKYREDLTKVEALVTAAEISAAPAAANRSPFIEMIPREP